MRKSKEEKLKRRIKFYKFYIIFMTIFVLYFLHLMGSIDLLEQFIDYFKINVYNGSYAEEVAILYIGFILGIIVFLLSYSKIRNKILVKIGLKNLGREFERKIATLFTEYGYKVEMPSRGKDFGADLLIELGGIKKAVQVKFRDKKNVGLKSVQEVHSALKKYDASQGIVITNKDFTKEAKELAKDTNVRLLRGVDYEGVIRNQKL